MHKLLSTICLIVVVAGATFAADAVESPSYTITNALNDSSTFITSDTLFQGTTISLTNCITMDTDNTTTQGLDSVTVEFKIGTASDNTAYTGTVYAVGGVTNHWYLDSIVIPTNITTPYCQTKLIDSLSAVRIYPWLKLRSQIGM